MWPLRTWGWCWDGWVCWFGSFPAAMNPGFLQLLAVFLKTVSSMNPSAKFPIITESFSDFSSTRTPPCASSLPPLVPTSQGDKCLPALVSAERHCGIPPVLPIWLFQQKLRLERSPESLELCTAASEGRKHLKVEGPLGKSYRSWVASSCSNLWDQICLSLCGCSTLRELAGSGRDRGNPAPDKCFAFHRNGNFQGHFPASSFPIFSSSVKPDSWKGWVLF